MGNHTSILQVEDSPMADSSLISSVTISQTTSNLFFFFFLTYCLFITSLLLTAEFASLPLIPAYLDPHDNEFLYGANFASGGSGVLVETNAGLVVDLRTQLQYFANLEKHYRQTLGDAKAEQLLSDAVYLFSCCVNDYQNFFSDNETTLHHEQFVGMLIGNLSDAFKEIHEKGGRKIGIGTVPPLGCLPAVRVDMPGNTCNEELNIIATLHNQALSNELQELSQELKGFMFAKYDILTAISKRIKNPSKYGAPEFHCFEFLNCNQSSFQFGWMCRFQGRRQRMLR